MKRERGFIMLIDLLLTMLLMATLLAMAVPQVLQNQRSAEMVAARARVLNLANVQSAIALCNSTPSCTPSVGLTAQVPMPGTIRQGAYQYTFTDLGGGLWSYQATATGSIFSPIGKDFWTSNSGVVYCGDWPRGSPC